MLSVFFSRLRERLHSAGIMSAHVIFGLDIIVSVVASFFTLLITDLLVPGFQLAPLFLWEWLGLAALSSAISFWVTRIYRIIVRYSTLQDLGRVALACLVKEGFLWAGMLLVAAPLFSPLSGLLGGMILIDFLMSVCALSMLRIVVFAIYSQLSIIDTAAANKEIKRVLVYGISDKAIAAHNRLRTSSHYRVVGFIVPGKQRRTHEIAGKPVYYIGVEDALRQLAAISGIDGILFPYIADARVERDNLMELCHRCGLRTYLTPNIDEMSPGAPLNSFVRKIRIEDLLGRQEIEISMDEITANFRDKTVLVTGAAGSIGSELCRQLAKLGVKQLVLFDNAETPLHYIRLELEDRFPQLTFTPIVGDVRSLPRLDYVFRDFRPQIVFHAAAYKHVPLMEENPCEAVLVNVVGSRNVADKCVEYGIEKMVMVSTDKAVNPTNIMGCTKRLAEIYCQSLGLAIEQGKIPGKTRFVTTRFGNVLGSNGSVIPRFREQIENGGPITVTHPRHADWLWKPLPSRKARKYSSSIWANP